MSMTERSPDLPEPDREPVVPQPEPGNTWVTPREERPPARREGTISDPDVEGSPPAPDNANPAERKMHP
jgi:hypothetical protein